MKNKNTNKNKRLIRLIAVLVAIAAVIIMGQMYYAYTVAVSMAKAQFSGHQMLMAAQVATGLDEQVESLVNEMTIISDIPEVRRMDIEKAGPLIGGIHKEIHDRAIYDIGLVDAGGRVGFFLNSMFLAGMDFSEMEFFRNAPVPGVVTYEFVQRPGKRPLENGIILSMPVMGEDGGISGFVVCLVMSDAFFRDTLPVHVHEDAMESDFWVTDSNGLVLFHPHLPVGTHIDANYLPEGEHEKFYVIVGHSGAMQSELFRPEGGKSLLSFYPVRIGSQHWTVVIEASEKAIFGVLSNFTEEYLTGIFLVSMMIIGGIVLLSVWNMKLSAEISSRDKVEEALKESEDRFRTLINQASEGVLILEDTGKGVPLIMDANISACKGHGYERSELIGKPISLLEVDDRGGRGIWLRGLDTGKRLFYTGMNKRRSGTTFPVEVSAQKINHHGKSLIIAIGRDISNRRAAETELQNKTHDLALRLRQLNCLYGISNIIMTHGEYFEDTCMEIVDALAVSWGGPEVACARIVIHDIEFRTEGFSESIVRHSGDIVIDGRRVGFVEVYLLEGIKDIDMFNYLQDDRNLLGVIAEHISMLVQRSRAEDALKKARAELETRVRERTEDLLMVNLDLGQQVAERTRAHEAMLSYQRSLEAMKDIAAMAISTLDPKEVINKVLRGTMSAIGASVGMFFLNNRLTGNLEMGAAMGVSDEFKKEYTQKPIRPGEGITGIIAQTGDPIFIEKNSSMDPRVTNDVVRAENLNSFIGVPILVAGDVLGVMNVATRSPERLEREKIEFLDAVGAHVGSAIRNAQLYEELKQSGQKILFQKDFLNSMLESLTHPIYVINIDDYSVKLANSAAGIGVLSGDSKCYRLMHKNDTPCDGGNCPCTIEEIRRTGKPVVLEHEHTDSSGETRIYEVFGYPIKDREGNFTEIIEYALDITQRRRHEVEIARVGNLESIGRLAAGIAHEINNPLTNASLAMQLILGKFRDNIPSPDMLRKLENVDRNIDKASNIARELLQFSRPGLTAFVTENINTIIKSSLLLVEYLAKRVTIEVSLGDVPDVLCDPVKLEQVFINVLINAVEAMPEGGEIFIESSYADGAVTVVIEDTGTGIKGEDLSKVYEPFFTTKDVGQGTGLGLSICYGIIKQHSGNISISSGKEKGAVVTISLPVI